MLQKYQLLIVYVYYISVIKDSKDVRLPIWHATM